jgi:hypothetical protein
LGTADCPQLRERAAQYFTAFCIDALTVAWFIE